MTSSAMADASRDYLVCMANFCVSFRGLVSVMTGSALSARRGRVKLNH
jgi:hypothetical protein